jgi:beta-mannanase
MLRSESKFESAEFVYTPQNIIDGKFDDDLRVWCDDARNFGSLLLAEYGTEVNSDSFPWSGVVNGAEEKNGYGDPTLADGPERFRDAYRHIIAICRTEGAVNITWVFHIDIESTPDESWNQFENYYPGDEWINWIGISVYGTYTPMSPYYSIFRISMDRIYPRILKLAPDKPIIVAEFGTAKNNPFVDQVVWTRNALTDITSLRYQNLIGFSWWNEAWINDANRAHDTTMRVQDNPDLGALFREMVGDNPNVIGEFSK